MKIWYFVNNCLIKGEPQHSDTTEMWQHPPVTYEVNIHTKRKVTVQNVICTQGLSLIIVVLFSRYTDIETLFSFISIIKKDNNMWSSIFWETHWYCLLGVYVIDPMWQSSFLGLEHDSLLDNTKVKSKSFVFQVRSAGEEILCIGLL